MAAKERSVTSDFSRRILRLDCRVTGSPLPASRASRSDARSRRLLWLALVPLAALLLVVAGLFGLRMWVYGYLRGDGFRRMVDQQASQALHADAKFGPLQFQDTEVYSALFDAVGHAESPLARMTAEQVRTRLELSALWRRAWRVDSIDVQRLGVTLAAEHPTPQEAPPLTENGPVTPPPVPASSPRRPPGFFDDWLPNRVEIGAVKIDDFSLAWNADKPESTGKLAGARLTAKPLDSDNRTWQIDGTEGRLTQTHFPAVRIGSFALRSAAHDLFITRVEGQVEDGGRIEISGKQGLDGERKLDLNADFDALPAAAYLPKDWRGRLKGLTHGNVHVTGSAAGDRRATGHVELRDGRLSALPMMDQLAVFAGSERYRQAPLQKARADFEWANGDVTVTNLLVESEGLLRLEGGFSVRGGQMDGTMQVGMARSSLRWLSAAGTQVFEQPERDGYLWTTVKLSGPANHPSEDLTPRLVAAVEDAAIKKAKQGTQSVLDTAKSLLDLLH